MMKARRSALIASIVVALLLVTVPLFAPTFFVAQIGIQSLFLGIVALSLIFLEGYGGMVSLVQVALYGVAGYVYAILTVTYNAPWYVGVLAGLLFTSVLSALFALIAIRTQGIYFLMITLAQAMLVYFYVNQDRIFAGGHSGINGVRPPIVGSLNLADPTAFYYMTLIVAALAYLGLLYLLRAPFGLALQGIRDNTQRMRSLGYRTSAHRVAAFTLAGFIAALGGIIGVWYNGSISPGSIDLTRTINVLVIAVLGGIGYVPQGRRIFPSLTVQEHMQLTSGTNRTVRKRWTIESVYELFPRLAERRKVGAGALSGGEQQMLAIARALLTNAHLLIMDEPSEGLAPAIVDQLLATLKRLSSEGIAMLIIEQKLSVAAALAEHMLVMVAGRIALETSSAALMADEDAKRRYLGVGESLLR